MSSTSDQRPAHADWLAGGEMGERIRAFDWSTTPLGPIDKWPQSLKTSVSTSLGCAFPIVFYWGPEFTVLYNDEYRPIFGAKHPAALGQPGAVAWASIWDVIGPMLAQVMEYGQATRSRDLMLHIDRDGYPEEASFSFSFCPVQVESGRPGGIFCPVIETTDKVVGERRLRTLRDLAAACHGAESEQGVCESVTSVLAGNSQDVPFAIIYRIDESQQVALLECAIGIAPGSHAAPLEVPLQPERPEAHQCWPLHTVVETGQPAVVTGLATHFDQLPTGAWKIPAHSCIALPIALPGQTRPGAVLAAAVSPMRPLDADYRTFFELLASQIASGLADAQALREERRRAEALAEIDRAKTAFFSNVSHEFRTPLTLMLGPLEELKAEFGRSASSLSIPQYQQLDLVHRNSLRLLKLTNTLLDFARMEAGRVQAVYEPTDLAALTAELASVFRSATEKAGLKLAVDCPPLSAQAFVDREMWEKIVLNLMSNAFKFTFDGEIEVSLRQMGSHFELAVRDTGIGIPADEVPKLFERFHRVAGAQGRTHEGSGIGLALVQELVRLHGGSVTVDSVYGKGTMFRVVIPLGHYHLPQEQIDAARTQASTALGARPFIEEALRWLPDAAPDDQQAIADIAPPEQLAPVNHDRSRVLVADDNADMRDYMRRLLSLRYDVEGVADGDAALAAIARRKPDLVLADIMMPRLDGLGLAARLRGNTLTSTLPIIFLSARAGEESRIAGLDAGADDYLTKPFSARELLARVEAQLKLGRLRREGEERAAADLEAMRRLQEVGNRCARAGNDFEQNLSEIVATAIVVTCADKGNLQLLDSKAGTLRIAAQRGFSHQFLHVFAEVEAGEPAVCGAALKSAGRVIVEDVTQSDVFADQPSLNVLLAENVRAVQSTPLIASSGQVYGVLSTHHRAPHRPSQRDLHFLDLLARQTADYLQRKQVERTQQLLVDELNHRVKNTLASVQAIAQQTLRSTKTPADFAAAFAGRIQSMARVHSLLSARTWQGVDLRDLIRDQVLAGAVDDSRVTAWGPPVHLEPQMALHLALMLHELGTNSIKYGALSKAEAAVTISWGVNSDRLHLKWAERGGPPVKAPMKRGFGMSLIEQSAKGEGGSAQLLILAEGLSWEIALPLLRSAENLYSRPTSEPETLAVTAGRKQTSAQPARLAGKRFLIIEDEPLIALDMAGSLEGAGAEVMGLIGTAEEALALVESTRPDAALLDGNLRGQAVGEIAASLTRHKVPFLFVTGYGRKSLPEAFGKAPMLAKPFSRAQLLEAARLLVEKPGAVVRLRE